MSSAVAAFAALCERFAVLCLEDQRPETERLPALRGCVGDLIGGVERLSGSVETYRDGPEIPSELPASAPLRALLGRRHGLGLYWVALAPLEFRVDPGATGCGDAIDDLADMLEDLMPGLWFVRAGRSVEAAGYWRGGFQFHWGDHAIGLLRALHEKIAGRDEAPEPGIADSPPGPAS